MNFDFTPPPESSDSGKLREFVNQQLAAIMKDQEEIVRAFIAKTGLSPDRCIMVVENTPNGWNWHVRERGIPKDTIQLMKAGALMLIEEMDPATMVELHRSAIDEYKKELQILVGNW